MGEKWVLSCDCLPVGPAHFICLCLFPGQRDKDSLATSRSKGLWRFEMAFGLFRSKSLPIVRAPPIPFRLKPFADILATGAKHWLTCFIIYLTLSQSDTPGDRSLTSSLSMYVSVSVCLYVSLCVPLCFLSVSLCVSLCLSCPLPCPISLSPLCTISVGLYDFVMQSRTQAQESDFGTLISLCHYLNHIVVIVFS